MKRLLVLLIMVCAIIPIKAQSYVDCPYYMERDTLNQRLRITRDFAFNPENDFSSSKRFIGPTDLDMYLVGASVDTATIEVYGIKRKSLFLNNVTTYTLEYVDSARVAVIPVTTSSAFHYYAIDPLYIYMGNFDGVRIIIKQGGLDHDILTVDSNIRIER